MRRVWVLLAVLTGLQVLDLVTTYHVLNLGGQEQNPPLAWVLGMVGFGGLVAIKVVGVGHTLNVTRLLLRRGRERGVVICLGLLSVVYTTVIGWNTFMLARYAS